jgi:hypothetical protein
LLKLDADQQAAKDVLTAAVQAEGDDVLSDYEEKFAKNNFEQLNRQGGAYDLSPARKQIIDQIEKKLQKEGLL